MKRQAQDTFGGPVFKKQRTSNHPQPAAPSQKLDTAGWGISDSDSDDDDDIHKDKSTSQHHNNGFNNVQNAQNESNHNHNTNSSLYSGVAHKLMSKMGYVQGTSLGKTEGGTTEPIA
eukprot:369928_1